MWCEPGARARVVCSALTSLFAQQQAAGCDGKNALQSCWDTNAWLGQQSKQTSRGHPEKQWGRGVMKYTGQQAAVYGELRTTMIDANTRDSSCKRTHTYTNTHTAKPPPTGEQERKVATITQASGSGVDAGANRMRLDAPSTATPRNTSQPEPSQKAVQM
jgi:hypothetical protein